MKRLIMSMAVAVGLIAQQTPDYQVYGGYLNIPSAVANYQGRDVSNWVWVGIANQTDGYFMLTANCPAPIGSRVWDLGRVAGGQGYVGVYDLGVQGCALAVKQYTPLAVVSVPLPHQ